MLESFIASLEKTHEVWAPLRLHDGTRSLGRLEEGPLSLVGDIILQKVTKVFFPPLERVATRGATEAVESRIVSKPLLVIGWTAQDADCLSFVDRFYADGYRDDLYCARREGAVIVCLTGYCGLNGQFQRLSRGNCDLEWVNNGREFLVLDHSETGRALIDSLPDAGVHAGQEFQALQRKSKALDRTDEALLQRASRLLLEGRVPETFWQTVADRCISCTSCNLVCPTCTCFDVFDRHRGAETERWRIWDSCLLDGFMREASGHNPMGQEWQRSRRRIHHKLGADVQRWGHVTCMLCGRCDRVCPTGIGIKAVCREIVESYDTTVEP